MISASNSKRSCAPECFATVELGISPEAARERRDAKKKKVGDAKLTPAMKPKVKASTKKTSLLFAFSGLAAPYFISEFPKFSLTAG